MRSLSVLRGSLVLLTAITVFVSAGPAGAAKAPDRARALQTASSQNRKITSRGVSSSDKGATRTRQARAGCRNCGGGKGQNAKLAQSPPCKPKRFVDPAISKNLNNAVKSMKRAGLKPMITSAWRSSAEQARLHKCSRNARCRRDHPGLYRALPAGRSLHEAAFAVDISGVASGPRGAKRLTPRGRRIVQIMKQNGFNWRYGLADPAHFESNPKRHGYRSVKQAIKLNQRRCQIKLASNRKPSSTIKTASLKRAPAQTGSIKNRRRDSRG